VGPFPGVKRRGHDVDHARPSIAAVKNEWNSVAAPLLCFLGSDKENFTVYFLLIIYFSFKRSVPIFKLN